MSANLIHPPRAAFLDPRGKMTREWYDFFARLSRDLNGGDLYSAGDGLSLTSNAFSIANVSNAMLRDGLGCSVIGRYQNSTGDVADIQAVADDRILGRFGGQLEFRAIAAIGASVADGDKGDITVSGTGAVWTVDNDVVTYAKMQNIATDTLIGRDTVGAGDPEAISVTGGIEFSGAGSIRTTAFTGDVTKAAGGTVTTIAADVVDNTRLANMAQATVKGRAAAAGTGDPTDLTATQAWGVLATTTQAITTSGLTIATSRLAGRTTAATGAIEEISVSAPLSYAAAALGITGSALTKTDDTNVTLTLGGTPATALLAATSLTLGWTGQLSAARGGTGVAALGDITRVSDTNVTLTLGGTPTGAVVTSTSFTMGWTGTLAVARGGTGGGAASGTLLDNISGFGSTGLLARTAAGTYAFRTLTGPAAGITVSNGDGVSGNPTLALANDLSALEALSGTNTLYYRSAADTWTAVTIGNTLSFSGGTLKAAMRGAMAKRSADWTAQDFSAGLTVQWDGTDVYDTDGIHDPVTNNTRLTTPSGVAYVRCGCTITLANLTAGVDLTVAIRKNGSTTYDGTAQTCVDAASTAPCLSVSTGPVPISSPGTDYFEVVVFTPTDASVDLTANRSNFWMEILE